MKRLEIEIGKTFMMVCRHEKGWQQNMWGESPEASFEVTYIHYFQILEHSSAALHSKYERALRPESISTETSNEPKHIAGKEE